MKSAVLPCGPIGAGAAGPGVVDGLRSPVVTFLGLPLVDGFEPPTRIAGRQPAGSAVHSWNQLTACLVRWRYVSRLPELSAFAPFALLRLMNRETSPSRFALVTSTVSRSPSIENTALAAAL